MIQKDWSDLLGKFQDSYAKGRPKRAQYLSTYLQDNQIDDSNFSVLEEGAFSAKDALFLSDKKKYKSVTVTDLNYEVVKRCGDLDVLSVQADAFNMPFHDGCFDLTFHSGLMVLFDNANSAKVLEEQYRITDKILFSFVHNKYCIADLVFTFVKRVFQNKAIFEYRRFSRKDVQELLDKTGLKGEIYHYDNVIENFLKRNAPFLLPLFKITGLLNSIVFSNELVLVVRK